MSVSAQSPRRGRLAIASALVVALVVALFVPANSTATRPVAPSDDPALACPSTGPKLKVKAPAKPVESPSTVRLKTRLVGVAGGECFDAPMRVCLRTGRHGERDLRIPRRCFLRGTPGRPISKTGVFMIRVTPSARGSYRLVVRAEPLRPDGRYRVLFAPRATTKLQVSR